MLTKEKILEALRKIRDPELHKSLVELDLIEDLHIDGNHVAATVVLVNPDSPHKSKLREQITTELKALGAGSTEIQFRGMEQEEQAALAARIRKEYQEKVRARVQGGHQEKVREKMRKEQVKSGVPEISPLLVEGSQTKFIAVASGKGGVGKSTVTVNLGVALARKGKKVGIIDADIYGFSVPDMMGIENRPTVVDKTIFPVERFGVKVISMSFFVQDNNPVIWRGPMLGKMLRNFLSEVHWDELDYMLLDLPPGTGDVALDVHQMIPQSKELIVTTPHATAAFVAARAGAMALHTNHEILGVVENMAYYSCSKCGNRDYIFGKGGGEKLAQELKTELLAQIPLGTPNNGDPDDPDFSPSIYASETEIGALYDQLAEQIIRKA